MIRVLFKRFIERNRKSTENLFILCQTRRRKVTVSKSSSKEDVGAGVRKTRNIGIMAHIDAGKTTTTERMLYYSGVIEFPGEVHHGDTVTDFLPQERERGITIQSAVVSFPWNDVSINLIDTPGHVDFTFEVQRSLRVVDSAVAILDASAGVEAQTLTVWRQATDYNLPRLIFLNKMDKPTASLKMCIDSIQSKLKSTPLVLQHPIYSQAKGSTLIGLIDLVQQKRVIYDSSSKGVKYSMADVSNDEDVTKARCNLVEQLADWDSEIANEVIEKESLLGIGNAELFSAMKRVTLSNQAVPVLLGSSYKNIGVQPLMDAICRYLPYPGEKSDQDPVVSAYGSELCCFAFKTLYDPQLGPLTFVRMFSGTLTTGQKVHNVTRGKSEKIGKIYRPLADDLKEVNQLVAGQVGVASGLKETYTGDTVTSSLSAAAAVGRKLVRSGENKDVSKKACLTGVQIPEPVFFCSIEPASISQQKSLDAALNFLQKEDPSLKVSIDPDTDQTVLSGMGELHLEIIHDRLKTDFKVDADLGKLQVAYKETILSGVTKKIDFERRLADQNQRVTIELELRPNKTSQETTVRRAKTRETQENLAHLLERQMACIENGVLSALRCGPKLGFPVVQLDVFLSFFESSRGTSDTIIEAAAATCIRNALSESDARILEPVVDIEIVVDENYLKFVIDDLHRRRFQMENVDRKHGNNVVNGKVPLNELLGYSTALRTISSGLGTFSMQFNSYQIVNSPIEESKIYEQIRGF